MSFRWSETSGSFPETSEATKDGSQGKREAS